MVKVKSTAKNRSAPLERPGRVANDRRGVARMTSVAKSTSYRLGLGAYQWPSKDAERAEGRYRFWLAVQRIKPRVFEQLAQAPFAAFCEAAVIVGPEDLRSWTELLSEEESLASLGTDGIEALPDEDAELAALSGLTTTLTAWGKRWRLIDAWCYDLALCNLAEWERQPRSRETLWLAGPSWGGWLPVGEDDRRFHFEHPGWDPTADTRKAAAAGIRAVFNRELDAYLDHVEAAAKAAGFVATHEKRRHYAPTPEEWRRLDHFAWLARAHIDEESGQKIADEARLDRRAVQTAIRELAALIDLKHETRLN